MKIKPLSYYNDNGLFWFRLFGFGLAIANHKLREPTFSEREGIGTFLHVKHDGQTFCVSLLTPKK